MACNIGQIRMALRDQILANLERSTNVYAYRTPWQTPCVTIEPRSPWVAVFETMGPNGLSDVEFDVVIYVSAENIDSAEAAMDDYVSIGVGNNSSVVDAIHSDMSLGGFVESCRCLTVGAPTIDASGALVARLPVQILLRKAGANV